MSTTLTQESHFPLGTRIYLFLLGLSKKMDGTVCVNLGTKIRSEANMETPLKTSKTRIVEKQFLMDFTTLSNSHRQMFRMAL